MILSPADVHYAKDHGVAKLGKDVRVFSIINVNLKIALPREHKFTVLLSVVQLRFDQLAMSYKHET